MPTTFERADAKGRARESERISGKEKERRTQREFNVFFFF